jgi:hypothetical protein
MASRQACLPYDNLGSDGQNNGAVQTGWPKAQAGFGPELIAN